ncbi:hypothetical protein Ancab_032938 [Ancistrocladus abbreviatus]
MGLLWWKRKEEPEPKTQTTQRKPDSKPEVPVPGMNGAVEVPRPLTDVTVFEFGSVAASADKVTLAGYCPVSDELEPCRWEILPAKDSNAPQFRRYDGMIGMGLNERVSCAANHFHSHFFHSVYYRGYTNAPMYSTSPFGIWDDSFTPIPVKGHVLKTPLCSVRFPLSFKARRLKMQEAWMIHVSTSGADRALGTGL